MASNRREDHEISMLSLHLIQNCMVYINTLMISEGLGAPALAAGHDATRLRGLDAVDLEPREPLRPL